jgi:hypothetical protein
MTVVYVIGGVLKDLAMGVAAAVVALGNGVKAAYVRVVAAFTAE